MKKLFVVFSVMFAVSAMATPILESGSTTWGSGPIVYSVSPGSGVTLGSATNIASQTIRFSFTAQSGEFGPAVRLADTGSNYTGIFNSLELGGADLSVAFTIKNLTAMTPNALSLYYITSGGVTNTSSSVIDITGLGLNDSMTRRMNIGSESSWGVTDSFATDFGSITQFGFELFGGPYLGQQQFEISNTYFPVPEPETLWMILAVLASLAVTFRSRLLELWKQALASIRT